MAANEKETYREGDLIKIRTNKCDVHLMEMFGGEKFNPDDIPASNYIGVVKSVFSIEDVRCYSVTIFTTYGECYHIIDEGEIIGYASREELPEGIQGEVGLKNPVDEIRFIAQDDMYDGLSPNSKRLLLAIAAVNEKHPDGVIRVVEMAQSQAFLRVAIKDKVDQALEECGKISVKRRKALEEKKDLMEHWVESLRFEEHYEYHVGVNSLGEDSGVMMYYMVAVNKEGTRAFVMKTREEQDLFFKYLGPDFQNMYMETKFFIDECRKGLPL